MCIYACDIVI